MDNDTIYKRIDIEKLSKRVKERSPETENARKIAEQMIREFDDVLTRMVREFEEGEGEFSACYFNVSSKHDV